MNVFIPMSVVIILRIILFIFLIQLVTAVSSIISEVLVDGVKLLIKKIRGKR